MNFSFRRQCGKMTRQIAGFQRRRSKLHLFRVIILSLEMAFRPIMYKIPKFLLSPCPDIITSQNKYALPFLHRLKIGNS